MKSLYDVFVAIQADEGDHVETMKACLDPNVAVQSPSIEQKVLIGAALVSAGLVFANTGFMPDIDILNGIGDGFIDAEVDGTAVDIAVGAGASLLSQLNQFFKDDEEAALTSELIEGVIEGGALIFVWNATKRFVVEFFTVIVKFFESLR